MNKPLPQLSLHMLVVDDNLVHRRMSQTILTAAGYEVSLAEGGPQALMAFAKSPADVVLLDVRMPGMDGFEVCQRLRALPVGKRVPILFLTDVADLASPDQAFSAGGDDFLNKPINRIELLMRVRSLLRARHHEAILDELLAEVRKALVVLDARGVITKWSRHAANFFGWSASDAIGRSLSQLVLALEHRQAFEEKISHYVSTGESAVINQRADSMAVHQDGRQVPIGLYATAIHTANETAFCVFIREASAPGA